MQARPTPELMQRTLDKARSMNFEPGQNLQLHFRGQCWLCLDPVDGSRKRGGPASVLPKCHKSNEKDRQRHKLGRLLGKGAWAFTTRNMAGLMRHMSKTERSFVLKAIKAHDILIVMKAKIQPRPYKNKLRVAWDLCVIKQLQSFIVSTQNSACRTCHRKLVLIHFYPQNTLGEGGHKYLNADLYVLRRSVGADKMCPLPECGAMVGANEGILKHVRRHADSNPGIETAAHAIQANARFFNDEELEDMPLNPSSAFRIWLNLAGFIQFTENWGINRY